MPVRQPLKTFGGIVGVDDRLGDVDTPSARAYSLENCVLHPPDGGPAQIHPRRGCKLSGSTVGTGSTMTQCMSRFTDSGGTVRGVLVNNGELYDTTDGASWTRRITTANLTAAGITLATSGHVYAVEYNNEIVFNDETNQPFMWDGTAGGGLTLLSNAPATCVGEPTVYYGKLIWIKSANVLVWSEEYAANTGYEAGGYNNSWTVGQTSGDPIFNIKGTNESLYYFRAGSIGSITGAVTPDFSTTGTTDSISTSFGTKCKKGVRVSDKYLFFLDANNRPMAVGRTGGPPIFLWHKLSRLHGETEAVPFGDGAYGGTQPYNKAGYQGLAQCIYHSVYDLIVFTMPRVSVGSAQPSRMVTLFHPETLECWGYWSFGTGVSDLYSVVEGHGLNDQIMMFGGYQGKVYRQSTLDTGKGGAVGDGDDSTAATHGVFPTRRVIYRPEPPRSSVNHMFDEARVVAQVPIIATPASGGSTFVFQYFTSLKNNVADLGSGLTSGKVVETATATGESAERQVAFGLDGYGRWIAPVVTMNQYDTAGAEDAAEETTINGVAIYGAPVDSDQATP